MIGRKAIAAKIVSGDAFCFNFMRSRAYQCTVGKFFTGLVTFLKKQGFCKFSLVTH